MGRRQKGTGLDAIRSRNSLKKQMLSSCRKYAEQLEKENYELKNDPNTMIGQFIGQFRELYGQNQRLSVLAASLIRKLDDKVVLSKEEMESFKTKRINIKWEIADGETIETAKEFTFTYELEDAPPQGQPVQATEQPTPAAIASAAIITEPTEEVHANGSVAIELEGLDSEGDPELAEALSGETPSTEASE